MDPAILERVIVNLTAERAALLPGRQAAAADRERARRPGGTAGGGPRPRHPPSRTATGLRPVPAAGRSNTKLNAAAYCWRSRCRIFRSTRPGNEHGSACIPRTGIGEETGQVDDDLRRIRSPEAGLTYTV